MANRNSAALQAKRDMLALKQQTVQKIKKSSELFLPLNAIFSKENLRLNKALGIS
jgi:hypothetical protein